MNADMIKEAIRENGRMVEIKKNKALEYLAIGAPDAAASIIRSIPDIRDELNNDSLWASPEELFAPDGF